MTTDVAGPGLLLYSMVTIRAFPVNLFRSLSAISLRLRVMLMRPARVFQSNKKAKRLSVNRQALLISSALEILTYRSRSTLKIREMS